jgi:hypothetical protein
LTTVVLTSSPVVRNVKDASADSMKKTDPTPFRAATHHPASLRRTHQRPWHTTTQASQLATTKHAEPIMSGAHTRRFVRWADERAARRPKSGGRITRPG